MLAPIKKFFYRGHSPYYYIRKHVFNLLNWGEHQRRKQISTPQVDGQAIGRLKHEGWCPVELPAPAVQQAADYCRQLESEKYPSDTPPDQTAGKDFWRLVIDRKNLPEHPQIIAFASAKEFKDFASAYLGEEAVLADISLMKSYPTGRAAKHSQLWHLDAADSKMVLFYVYCRDVDENSGPFTLARKDQMKPFLRPRGFRRHGYTDEEILQMCPPEAIVTVTGPAGTAFACDTAQTYHQGSRCKTNTRLALAIRYTTFSGLYPVDPITL